MHAFRETHVETYSHPMHASQEPHENTFACTMYASQEPHADTFSHPLVLDTRDDVSSKSNQISDMIFELDLDDIEHAYDDIDQIPKWE
jgi:hypothetical protein